MYVSVHDVEGVASGLSRWPDLSAPIRTGQLRDELARVALEQPLAGGAFATAAAFA